MKLNTISNVLEYQETIYEGVLNNITSKIVPLPGLPDICFVYKRFKKAISLSKYDNPTTSFHFI